MIPQLYEKFNDWNRYNNIWVYSDTHFDDPNCKQIDPDWPSPQKQIDLINKKVHKNDAFILLGDVGNPEWIRKIKAKYKILIKGNHDKGNSNYLKNKKEEMYDEKDWTPILIRQKLEKEYPNSKINIHPKYHIFRIPFIYYPVTIDNLLFDEVYEGPLFIGKKLLLSHEPIDIDCALNIHGHCHNLPSFSYDNYHYNVCSNAIDYDPVNLKDIINSKKYRYIEDIHRQVINTCHPIDIFNDFGDSTLSCSFCKNPIYFTKDFNDRPSKCSCCGRKIIWKEKI